MSRLKLVIFDVNETLFSLAHMGTSLARAGLPEGSLALWFARVLRDGMALATVGQTAGFRQLAGIHLRRLLASNGLDSRAESVESILSAFAELDAHADAEPALAVLRDAGMRCVTLTNGHADMTEALCRSAGLDQFFERYLSVDGVGLWKPRPEPYRYALDTCGVEPDEAAMVAVHSWDVDGAKRAGLTTGYASRLEGAFIDVFAEPDVVGTDLVEVARGLAAL